tara:strand:- start:8448 stop:8762 length:315 start_codon:yes stop_codon:yes gene_type:complete
MPYCHHYLKIHHPEHLDSTVRLLAKEQFHSRDAYQYNIDGSMNDVRAIKDTNNLSIRLFCRYAKDVQRFNQRMVRFADSHPDICGVFDEGDEAPESITFNLSWK